MADISRRELAIRVTLGLGICICFTVAVTCFVISKAQPVPVAPHSEAECFRRGIEFLDELKASIPESVEFNREFIEDCLEGTKQHFIAEALELEAEQ